MMLVGSVKLRIVKPIGRDWAEVGPRLRDLSWIAHRVLNGTMTRLAMSAEIPDRVPPEWKSRENQLSEKRPGGKPSSYQMAACAIERANEERIKRRVCAWCAGTGVEPEEPPRKRSKKQPERVGGETCSRCDGAKAYTIGEPVDIPSAIQLGWQRLAERRHKTDRVDVLRGAKSIASFRAPAPIAITSSGRAFELGHDGRGWTLDAPIYPGGASGRVKFALAPDGRGAYTHLNRIRSGGQLGDLKIISAGAKWIAIISYSWEESVVPSGSGDPALLALAEDGSPEVRIVGRKPKRLYEGSSIEHARRKFSARRKSRSRHQRDIAGGARGHGRARALEHYHAVDDAEQRWLRSISQEIAAKAVREAILRGAKWVDIDAGVGAVLRVGVLKEALAWALKKTGFADPQAQSLAVGDDSGRAI